ncbi:MAG TPA: hypothetical protein PK514_14735 [Spirochaetota bacterium]|nr:hypothetical protein [Spirochaetota bacterium]
MKKPVKTVGVNKAEFARMANVNRSSVTRAIKSGLIVADEKGMIDINSAASKFYIEQHLNPADSAPIDGDYIEEKRKNIILKNLKLQQEINYKAGRLLEKSAVESSVFLYLDNVFSNLERLAGIFLDDVTSKILTEGLTPEVRAMWKNAVLSEIDTAKNTTVKKIEEIADSQK